MRSLVAAFIVMVDLAIVAVCISVAAPLRSSVAHASTVAMWLSLYCVGLLIVYRRSVGGVFLVFFAVFIVCSLGRAVLVYSLGFKSQNFSFESLGAYDEYEIGSGLLLSILSMMCLHAGAFIYAAARRQVSEPLEHASHEHATAVLRRGGLVLLLVCILPAAYDFVSSLTVPYGQEREITLWTQVAALSTDVMLVALVFLVVGYGNYLVTACAIAFYIPQYLLGARGEPTIAIVIILLLHFHVRSWNRHDGVHFRRLRARWIVISTIGVVLVANLFSVIGDQRGSQVFEGGSLLEIYTDKLLHSNPVYELVYELGVALAPLTATMRHVPLDIPYQYGKSFFYSLVCAVPDIYQVRPAYMTELGNFPQTIATLEGASFGASMLQELWLNFGWLTPLAMMLIGVALCGLSERFSVGRNPLKIALVGVLLRVVFWWPRSSVAFSLRYLVVTLTFAVLVYAVSTVMVGRKGTHTGALRNETTQEAPAEERRG